VIWRATVEDLAIVREGAVVVGEARVSGSAEIAGDTRLTGAARIRDVIIRKSSDFLVIGPIGSRGDYLTVTIPGKTACTGCFSGDLDDLEAAARKADRQEYLIILPAIRELIAERESEQPKTINT